MSFGAADASIFIQIVGEDDRLKRALNRSKKEMRQWGREMQSLGSGLSFNPITAGMAAISVIAANSYSEYEKHLNRVQAVTSATIGQMGRLTSQALELGKTTIFSGQQAAEGMAFLGMAGFDALEVLKAMPGVTKLAAIGMTDVSKAADIATNILLGFGLEVEEIARVNDVMAAAITDSNTDLKKLGSALSYAAPLAKAAGWSLEEATASIMSVSDAGIQGTRAGTSLRNMIMRLTKPSAKAAEIMQLLGINVLDSTGNLKDMDKIVEEFVPHMEKAGEMAAIFGARAAPGMLKILRSGVSDFRDDVANLTTSMGLSNEMADIMVQGFYGKMVRLKSAIHTLFIEVGDSISGPIGDVADFITHDIVPALSDMAGWFETLPRPIQYTVMGFGALLASIGPILWTLGPMVTAFSWLNDSFVVTAVRAKALRLVFQPLMAGFGSLTRTVTGLGGITIAASVFDTLRARMGSVGKEAVTVASKMNTVTQAVAGVAVAAAGIGIGPTKGLRSRADFLRNLRSQEHGLMKNASKPGVNMLGGFADRLERKPSTVGGFQANQSIIGLQRFETQARSTTKVIGTMNEVGVKGSGVFKVLDTSAVSSARATIGVSSAFSVAAKKLVNFRVGMGATGIAVTAVSLISKDFGRVIDESFGVGISVVKLFGRVLLGLPVEIVKDIGTMIGKIGDLFSTIDEGISNSTFGTFLSGLADQIGSISDLIDMFDASDFLSFAPIEGGGILPRQVLRDSPDVGPPEGWGDIPESMRESSRLPNMFSDKRYDFGQFARGIGEVESAVRKAREQFDRGEISLSDYEKTLDNLSAASKSREFQKWMKAGDRSFKEQIKWLRDYGREAEEAETWFDKMEKAKEKMNVGVGGMMFFLPEGSVDLLSDNVGELDILGGKLEAWFDKVQNARDKFAGSVGGVDFFIPTEALKNLKTFKSFTDGTGIGGIETVIPNWKDSDGAETRIVGSGVGIGTAPPFESGMFDEVSEEADGFDRLLENLSNSVRSAGGESAGAFANMAQVAITSFRSIGEGIRAAEMASIILAVVHGIYELSKALGVGAATAEEITQAFDDTTTALEGVRSGAYTTSEALDYMANWSGNQEGFEFLRNAQQDAIDLGLEASYATDLVGDLWDAMKRMNESDTGSEKWLKAKEDYDKASEGLVNLASNAKHAREQTEQLNLMTGTLSKEAVENLQTVETAYYSLDEATQQTALATKIYAEALLDAQEAGRRLTDQEQKIVDKHRENEASVDNLTDSIRSQIGVYFSLMDSAKETYDTIYKAAREAGLSEEEAARAAAEYQAAMAKWTMEVEEIKFLRMVFLDELLFQIRAANNENAALSAEAAARRAVEAWAKAREILDDPYVQEILGEFELPPMPEVPYVSVGSRGGGGGGGGGGGSVNDRARIAAEALAAKTDYLNQMIGRLSEDAVKDLTALNDAYSSLDETTKNTVLATSIYAEGLIKARDAGHELTDAQLLVINRYEEQSTAIRIAAKETDYLNQMTGTLGTDSVESLIAAGNAYFSLDEATRNTALATGIYAGVLIKARDAGHELTDAQLLVINRYEEQSTAIRIAAKETDYLNQMTGTLGTDSVESLTAAGNAYFSLDEATRNTALATGIYAGVLIKARDAGHELTDAQLLVINRYEEQSTAIRIAAKETDYLNQMTGTLGTDSVESLTAVGNAYFSLDKATRNTVLATGIYAKELIKARNAGHKLMDHQKYIISMYEMQNSLTRMVAKETDYLNKMTGKYGKEGVENLFAAEKAFLSLDKATQNTALATSIYAKILIAARDAGYELTESSQEIVDRYKEQTAAVRITTKEIDYLSQMTGKLSSDSIESFTAAENAYLSLDKTTRNTALATKIYAEALIEARNAGHELTKDQQLVVDRYQSVEASIQAAIEATSDVGSIFENLFRDTDGPIDAFFDKFSDRLKSVLPGHINAIRSELGTAFDRMQYDSNEALKAVKDLGILTPYKAIEGEDDKEGSPAETSEEFGKRVKTLFGAGSLYSVSMDQNDLANWSRQLSLLERGGLSISVIYDNMSNDIRTGMIDTALSIGIVPVAMGGLIEKEKERLKLLIDTGKATDYINNMYTRLLDVELSDLTRDQQILVDGFSALLNAMGAEIPESLSALMKEDFNTEENDLSANITLQVNEDQTLQEFFGETHYVDIDWNAVKPLSDWISDQVVDANARPLPTVSNRRSPSNKPVVLMVDADSKKVLARGVMDEIPELLEEAGY